MVELITATQLDELVIKTWFVRNALNNVDVAGMRQTLKTGSAKQIYSCTKGCCYQLEIMGEEHQWEVRWGFIS